MKPVWRWFGPDDPITLAQIRQAGASGIVTALHNYAPGEPWPAAEIERTRLNIEKSGLTWDVCESIWMSDAIKLKGSLAKTEIEAWLETMRNLAAAGVKTICYNFMPVLDWTRTDLAYRLPHGGTCMRFDIFDFAAFDIHILQRNGASESFDPEVIAMAEKRFRNMSEEQRQELTKNLVSGLPGANENLSLADLRQHLAEYDSISAKVLRQNFVDFLEEVIPVAEEASRIHIPPGFDGAY